MKLVRRIAATGCALPLALGGLIAAAPSASASSQNCSRHVLEKAPGSDKELVEDACRAGEAGGEDAFRTCYHLLRVDYVPAVVAADACRSASRN